MKHRFPVSLLAVIALVVAVSTGLADTAAASGRDERPGSQVVFEGGYLRPYGDLAGDFPFSPRGFGAKEGHEIGFRWRYFLTPSFSVSPGFHFANFGQREGEHGDVGEYRVKSTSYRYTLELMVMQPGDASTLRPFLGAAWGVYRNRVEGWEQDFSEEFDASVNTLGFSVRAGVHLHGFELSMLYSFNRFHTWQFYDTGFREVYGWDNFAVRVGWNLPLGK